MIYSKKELNEAVKISKDILNFFGNIKTIDEEKQRFFKNGINALNCALQFINFELKKDNEKITL